VTHSWYKYPDEAKGLHPFDGVTEPNFVLGKDTKGSRTEIKEIDESAKYSWVKAPRWKGNAVEVGPLARYVVAYARGRKDVKEQVDAVLKTLDVPITALFSTLGRTAARGLECQWAARKMKDYYNELIANIKAGDLTTANTEKWEPSTWPAEAKGAGPCEAPRGALGHWIKIKGGKIDSYQCVVPTTWNGGPRDAKGQIGAFEAALMNTPLAKPEQPVEILRTIHSFDPCLACASHVMGPDGEELVSVKVR
jgi:hydrogenase large subunit